MLMIGLETLPSRINRLPATKLSVGLVMSFSSPMSPFSPGTLPGQSSMIFAGSAAGELVNRQTAQRKGANRQGADFMRQMKRISEVESNHFRTIGPRHQP